MPIDNTNELTVKKINQIIHSLQMSNLSFVEENAIDEIKAMIKALPSPEKVEKMIVDSPMSIKKLQMDIGNLLRIIELYGKRDVAYKTRYKSRTGLPPRYKVLDWRMKMKPEVKASVKEMVKMSADLDSKGYGEISGSINKFAARIVKEQFDEVEYEKVSTALSNAKLGKEAQFWQGVKELGKGVGQWAKGVGQTGKEMFQVGKYKAVLSDINKKIDTVLPNVQKAMQGAQDPNRKQQLNSIVQMLGNMSQVGKQVYKLVEDSEKMEAAKPATGAPTATGTPAASGTETPEAIQKQIADLQAKLQSLQGK